MRGRRERLQQDTSPSLKDVIELDDEFYIVTNIDPLELTAIEHYDARGDN